MLDDRYYVGACWHEGAGVCNCSYLADDTALLTGLRRSLSESHSLACSTPRHLTHAPAYSACVAWCPSRSSLIVNLLPAALRHVPSVRHSGLPLLSTFLSSSPYGSQVSSRYLQSGDGFSLNAAVESPLMHLHLRYKTT